jgi:hypothetical protein
LEFRGLPQGLGAKAEFACSVSRIGHGVVSGSLPDKGPHSRGAHAPEDCQRFP